MLTVPLEHLAFFYVEIAVCFQEVSMNEYDSRVKNLACGFLAGRGGGGYFANASIHYLLLSNLIVYGVSRKPTI